MDTWKAVLFAGIVAVAALLPGMVGQVGSEDVEQLRSRLDKTEARLEELESRLGGGGEIRARKFVVVDQSGQQRAVLGMGEDQPVFMVADEKGNPCCLLGTYDGEFQCCCVRMKKKEE